MLSPETSLLTGVYDLFCQRVDEALHLEQLRVHDFDGLGSLMERCGINGCSHKITADPNIYQYIVTCKKSATLEELSKSSLQLEIFIESIKDRLPVELREIFNTSLAFTEEQKISYQNYAQTADDLQKSLDVWPNHSNKSQLIVTAGALAPERLSESVALIQSQSNPKISLEIKLPADIKLVPELVKQIQARELPCSSIVLFIEGSLQAWPNEGDLGTLDATRYLLQKSQTICLRNISDITQDVISDITSSVSLQSLLIDCSEGQELFLSPESLDSIANPENLRRLGLPNYKLDNACLERVGRLFPNLEVLDISGSGMHAADLPWLSPLRKLERLFLNSESEYELFKDEEALTYYTRIISGQEKLSILDGRDFRQAIYTNLGPNLPRFAQTY